MKHDLIENADDARAYIQKFIMWPKQWRALSLPVLRTWNSIKYTQNNIRKLPDQNGIYVFMVKPNIAKIEATYLMYIGIAKDQTLKQRCSQYMNEARSNKPRMRILRMFSNWKSYLYLHYATFNTQTVDLIKLEEKLLAAFLPPANTKFPGKLFQIAKDVYGS